MMHLGGGTKKTGKIATKKQSVHATYCIDNTHPHIFAHLVSMKKLCQYVNVVGLSSARVFERIAALAAVRELVTYCRDM